MKIAVLSLIIAIGALLFTAFQYDRTQKYMDEIKGQLSSQTLIQQKFQNGLNSTLEPIQKDINSIKEEQKTLFALPRNNTPADELSSVRALIETANRELQITRNTQMPLDLLESAEAKLKSYNNPNLNALIESVAEDLKSLKALDLPDKQKLWLQVNSLIETASHLEPFTIEQNKGEEKGAPPASEADNSWKVAVQKNWDELKGLIKIRQHSKPIEPLLNDTQKRMVKDNIRALLEQIRFAILMSDDKIFHQSIQDTKQWLNNYYDASQADIKNLLKDLEDLNKITLKPELPPLKSLNALKSLKKG